ncbi:glycosyl hydrolase [Dehalococcoides mccartyi]|uniref:glycosyltransferase family 4 protein n=1 Tax=Dehalococcoides mccartyi TaxID=61435 RepID=UPI00098F3988|nr:glycosyltransferase family 4 protein [Dehalococcoides mccartyi]AQU05351.1 glycosyl hydrolase [Dehalococcoides mccartyi]AQU06804.1 glycosyl hydrolase [Dehalococcoides mccartyi]
MIKICLIGDFKVCPDRSIYKMAAQLADFLSKEKDILLLLCPREHFPRPRSLNRIRRFQPDIIHLLGKPDAAELFRLKMAKLSAPRAKTVISAQQPVNTRTVRNMLPYIKPDMAICLSQKSASFFREAGIETVILPNGVDMATFQPVSPEIKAELRRRYCLPHNKLLLLHVGPIRAGRGVDLLRRMQNPDTQVIMAVSNPGIFNRTLLENLRKSGCMILTSFRPNIADLYALADAYVYPMLLEEDANHQIFSSEMPLSVLEAMSANLPVITTPFGALPEVFPAGEGLYYAHDDFEFLKAFQAYTQNPPANTRHKVATCAWPLIITSLKELYTKLLA